MTTRVLSLVLLAVAAAAGCSTAANSMGTGGGSGTKADAGPGGWGGSTGAGGMVISFDASAPKADGSGQTPINLSGDAPTFNWDTLSCNGCESGGGGGGTGPGGGGTTGAGTGGMTSAGTGSGGSAAAGAAGSSSRGGAGGAVSGSGGRASTGGNSGSGGASSRGGSTGGGGSLADAGQAFDAKADSPVSPFDGGTGDSAVPRDTVGGGDLASDLWPPDTTPRCDARIRSLIPMSDQPQVSLVSGANAEVVLRVEVLSGGSASPAWSWQGTWQDGKGNKAPVSATPGQDLAAAKFPIAQAGTYAFTATDGARCAATFTVAAAAPNSCPGCDQTVIIRSVPPPDQDIPVQTGNWTFQGGPLYLEFKLWAGERIWLSPSAGSRLIQAYVRINNTDGELAADGLADPNSAFSAVLRRMAGPTVLRYDVLVVPIDGVNGSSIAATAPQLFASLAASEINNFSFSLGGGYSVIGSTKTPLGAGVVDARVILANRDPTAADQQEDLIFSSVGRGDAQGNFVLHAQPPGPYWVSVSPPIGSGLAEAVAPDPIMLSSDATVSFQWLPSNTTTLVLNVVDANGKNVDGARVRLTSAQTSVVGTLTFSDAKGSTVQSANGNVRAEAITVSGNATFTSVPVGVAYKVLVTPPALQPSAATTLASVNVPAECATPAVCPPQVVQLAPQGRIAGKLVSGSDAPQWSLVNLVAYDRSADTPEAPQTVVANSDGTFSIGVSPGRPYVVIAVPDTSTSLARTFVGPGLLQATEFRLTQKVQGSRPCSGRVTDESNQGIEGTALQVYCAKDWPGCIDPTIPLAETTAGYDGAYQLALPDPATR